MLITQMFSNLHTIKLSLSIFNSFRGQGFIILKKLIYKMFGVMSTTTIRDSTPVSWVFVQYFKVYIEDWHTRQ
jgi:hypothetical protein